MTIEQITQTVAAVKPASRRQVVRYLNALEISPVGARQRPQNYPDDAANRILKHLGLNGGAQAKRQASTRIPSMAELRAERKKAGRK